MSNNIEIMMDIETLEIFEVIDHGATDKSEADEVIKETPEHASDYDEMDRKRDTETGICRRCGCTWNTACIDAEHGACWWVDKNRTLCSHCFYGMNDESIQMKVYYRPGRTWLEEDEEFAEEILTDIKRHWVYDMEQNVLCAVRLGGHIGAVRFIAKQFYGLDSIYREEIPKWQEIISNNMIFYNAMVDDPKHYAWHLPRKYRLED